MYQTLLCLRKPTEYNYDFIYSESTKTILEKTKFFKTAQEIYIEQEK